MATYELTISPDYVPTWGIQEGVREILQNAIDADTAGYPMSYTYDETRNVLKIENEGGKLYYSTLLMGETTKAGQANQIGEFGEGYKLGILALLRAGKQVKIFNRCSDMPQKWEASLTYSEKYTSKILCIKTINLQPQAINKLTFQIEDITPDEWDECKRIFLHFKGAYGHYNKYQTYVGDVLEGEDVKGCLFVSDILISKDEKLWYGYNFKPQFITLNRDRSIIDRWSRDNGISRIWNHLGNEDKYIAMIENMLINNADDVASIGSRWYVNKNLTQKIAERFKEKHGQNAHPVSCDTEEKSLGFYNVRGIIAPKVYADLIEQSIGTCNQIIETKKQTPVKSVEIEDLNEQEKCSLLIAKELINKENVLPHKVLVVEFHDRNVMGRVSNGTIEVSRYILSDLKTTLITLIHEYSHISGEDGTVNFQEAQNELWAKIVVRMLREKQCV